MRELAAGGATPRLEDVGQDHQFGLSEPSNVVPRWADRYLVSMLDCVDAASEMGFQSRLGRIALREGPSNLLRSVSIAGESHCVLSGISSSQ